MASRSVVLLKLVGTVSLGLFTGVSYSLSTLMVPTLLTLPSAGAAARAFESLAASARSQLGQLGLASSSALVLAYVLSPRAYRHPYLLYTSALVLSSRLVVFDLLAPHLFPAPAPSGSAPTAAASRKRRTQASRARMEASYEVLGSSASDAHSEGTTGSISSEEPEAEEGDHAAAAATAGDVNGEEVRAKVELFLKKQLAQTVVAGLGFIMAVVGIWGDGVAQIYEVQAVVF